jgi:hypothetical protein
MGFMSVRVWGMVALSPTSVDIVVMALARLVGLLPT